MEDLKRQDRRQVDEQAFFILSLSVPHSLLVRQPLFHSTVIQTRLGSSGPWGRLKPHELASSCRDTRPSIRLDQALDQPLHWPLFRLSHDLKRAEH